MAWRAFYNTASGDLFSVGTVWGDTPPGMSFIEGIEPIPDMQTQMWDKNTRQFVTRPPKVLVNRFDDMLTDSRFTDFITVYNSLNAIRKAQVRQAIERLLGSQLNRAPSENLIL